MADNAQSDAPKATRFQLGKDGPFVSAEPELASYLQGKGDSPVSYAQSAPLNPEATVGSDEGSGAELKKLDRPDRDVRTGPLKPRKSTGN